MFDRVFNTDLEESLKEFPAIGILGPRQVGKTTLAKSLISKRTKPTIYLDLERPSDIAKLQNAELFFTNNRDKCVILDEVQRMPELFPILRSEIDDHRIAGRFVLLGSASPELIRTSSESLAGRIIYHELSPFLFDEIKTESNIENHWLFGGFPEPFLKKDVKAKSRWFDSFIRSYIERDLPALGLNTSKVDLSRLLSMIAHEQGQPENNSKLAQSLGVKSPTIKNTIDFLEQAYLIRRIPAWFSNAKKRIVKSPRLYMRDTGILHHLLGIDSYNGLLSHPILGFSFEAYAISQIMGHPENKDYSFYYYRTQDGTECDLLAVKNDTIVAAFEFKMTSNPTISKGIRNAIQDLNPKNFYIVIPRAEKYQIDQNVWVYGAQQLNDTILQFDT